MITAGITPAPHCLPEAAQTVPSNESGSELWPFLLFKLTEANSLLDVPSKNVLPQIETLHCICVLTPQTSHPLPPSFITVEFKCGNIS